MIYTFKYYALKVRKYIFRVDNSSFVFFLKNYSHFCYFFFIVPYRTEKYRQSLIHNLILKYSTRFTRPNTCQMSVRT